MKNVKKFAVLTLAGVFCAGTVLSASAASFDASWYAAKNPDVVAVFGDSAEALKEHYDKHGKYEHRMFSADDVAGKLYKLFNLEEYKALYPDVVTVFGDDADAIFQHYMSYGILEGRRPAEKVTIEVARALKNAVIQALTDAGLDANPGSVDLAMILSGDAASMSGVLEEVITKVQEVVEQAIVTAIQETTKVPVANNDSDSSDQGTSSDNKPTDSTTDQGSSGSGSGSSDNNTNSKPTETPTESPTNEG